MHETELPRADQALAARLGRYFDTESIRAEATASALVAPGGRGRARPLVIRFAPLGGGFAAVAVLAIALAILPFRGGGTTGGGGGSQTPVAASSPSPAATHPAVVYEGGVPVEIDGERVYGGTAIRSRMLQAGSFLAAGPIAQVMYDCAVGACPENGVWTLGASPSGLPLLSGVPLLEAGRVWVPSATRWSGGIVVLRVRAYDASCPWAGYCKSALLVEAAIPPR